MAEATSEGNSPQEESVGLVQSEEVFNILVIFLAMSDDLGIRAICRWDTYCNATLALCSGSQACRAVIRTNGPPRTSGHPLAGAQPGQNVAGRLKGL